LETVELRKPINHDQNPNLVCTGLWTWVGWLASYLSGYFHYSKFTKFVKLKTHEI